MAIDGNAYGPIYTPPRMGQGNTYRRRWPTTREGIEGEYSRREEAYTGADYTDNEVQDYNLVQAKNGDNQVIATAKRITSDIRFVVHVDAASIASDGVALQVREAMLPGGQEAAPLALELGQAVWRRSGVGLHLLRWASNTCILGDYWLEVQRGPSGAVLVGHDPRRVVAKMDPTGQTIQQLVVSHEYTDDTAIDPRTGAFSGKPEQHTYRRVVTPEEVRVYRDDQLVPHESGPNTLGVVPAVRLSYRPILDGHLSEWAGSGYEAAVAAVDSARTQVLSIVTRHANPILALIGARLAAGEDLQTIGRTIAVPGDADVKWLEAALNGVQVAVEQADALRNALKETLPEFLFVESGASSSGSALSYRAGAFVAKIEPIRQSIYAQLSRCIGWAVAIDAGARWSDAADYYQVDGGEALPMDVSASSALYTGLAAGGWLTGADTVRRLQGLQLIGPDEDPAEYYARAQADLQARSGAGLSDARDLLEQLRALESGDTVAMDAAEAAHEAAEAPEVEAAEEEAEAAGMPEADAGEMGEDEATGEVDAMGDDTPDATEAAPAATAAGAAAPLPAGMEALNGAQAQFLLDTVAAVTAGELPRSAAITAVQIALPQVDPALVERMFADVVAGSAAPTEG